LSALLEALLRDRSVLIADGATATNLIAQGLRVDEAPDPWNLAAPEPVADLHARFIAAGADIVLTNTFGANRCRLASVGAAEEVAAINEAGVRLARAAAARAGRAVVVAGSMGPTGERLDPAGALSGAACEAAFREQADALAAAGADVLWLETFSAFDELAIAVSAARRTGLGVMATLSFGSDGNTLAGHSPEAAADAFARMPVVAYGANCGAGPAALVDSLRRLFAAGRPDALGVAKANCGIPDARDGRLHYPADAAMMAAYARLARDCGARIIGGCCGATPGHIAAIRRALEGHAPGATPTRAGIEAALGPIA